MGLTCLKVLAFVGCLSVQFYFDLHLLLLSVFSLLTELLLLWQARTLLTKMSLLF